MESFIVQRLQFEDVANNGPGLEKGHIRYNQSQSVPTVNAYPTPDTIVLKAGVNNELKHRPTYSHGRLLWSHYVSELTCNLLPRNQTQGEDGYFDGVISIDNGDATYKVDFDDGDVLDAAPRHDIRVLSWPHEVLPNVSHETQK